MTRLSGLRSWIVLSLLAELASRHRGVMMLEPRPRASTVYAREHDTRTVKVTVEFPRRVEEELTEILAVLDHEHVAHEIAERSMVHWGELADHYRGSPAEFDEAMEVDCPMCEASRGMWCSPVHHGERAPGDWVHPARSAWWVELRTGTSVDRRPDPRALQYALEMLDHPARIDNPRATLRGMPRALVERVQRVARELVRLTSAMEES